VDRNGKDTQTCAWGSPLAHATGLQALFLPQEKQEQALGRQQLEEVVAARWAEERGRLEEAVRLLQAQVDAYENQEHQQERCERVRGWGSEGALEAPSERAVPGEVGVQGMAGQGEDAAGEPAGEVMREWRAEREALQVELAGVRAQARAVEVELEAVTQVAPPSSACVCALHPSFLGLCLRIV